MTTTNTNGAAATAGAAEGIETPMSASQLALLAAVFAHFARTRAARARHFKTEDWEVRAKLADMQAAQFDRIAVIVAGSEVTRG